MRTSSARRGVRLLTGAALLTACSDSPTAPERQLAASEITELMIFVRDWPNEYVEIALRRGASGSTFLVYRPPQPGVPRVLLDSVGPSKEDPPEMVELLGKFDIWAMSDSNAVGAACSTRGGGWNCNPTFNDYSLVIGVKAFGTTRAQRYTRLQESTSSRTARALGDFVFAMARKRAASKPNISSESAPQPRR